MMGRTEQGLKNRAISNARYDKDNTRSIKFKFNLKTDADILEKLDSVDNKQGYIKRLIREDIARNAPKLYVADRETGTFIEPVSTLGEGLRMIEQFEESDRQEGTFQEDFYTIVNQDHVSII